MQENFRSVTGQVLQKRVWKPEGDIRAVVQIAHGMAEHIGRYDETAKRLNREGILVVGHNYPGHGETAELLGWFGPGGFGVLVEDVHALRKETQTEYPGVPYFLLGLSMGSFVVRNYCLKHGRGLHGVLLSGSGHYSPPLISVGLVLANLFCWFGAGKKPSKLLEAMSFAGYNRDWSPPRTPKDWLTRDERTVDAYIADPLCGFTFTAGAYRDMFRGLKALYPWKLAGMEKDVPVLLYAGSLDPVSGRGRGVQKVAAEIRAAGVRDVTVKLYEGGRHEMHNELNREEVWRDLIDWIVSRL